MPGDTVRITAPVCRRVEKLLPHLAAKLEEKYGEYIPAKLVIAISGGSGSGKTSGAVALREALAQVGLTGYVLSGDNYPRRVPEHNDEERLAIFRSVGLKALLAAGAYTPERFAALQSLQKAGTDSDPQQCEAYPWLHIYQQGGRAALAGYLGQVAEQDYDALNEVLAQFRACRVARSRDAGADSPFVTMVLEIEQAMLNRRACDADLIQNRDGTMVDTAAYAAAQGR